MSKHAAPVSESPLGSLDELYPSPTWEPYLVCESPESGRLEILATATKLKGKGVPAPPTTYVQLPTGAVSAPKALHLDGVLRDALRQCGLAGELVSDTIARTTIRWTPSLALTETARRLVSGETPSDSGLPGDVTRVFRGFAAQLAALVDVRPLLTAALDSLGVGETGAVALRTSSETDYDMSGAMAAAALAAAPAFATMGGLRVGMRDFLPALNLVGRELSAYPAEDEDIRSTMTLHMHAGRATGWLTHHAHGPEWYVRPAYLAADDLVATLALRHGVAALTAEDLPEGLDAAALPPLYLEADSLQAVPALSVLLTPGLRLVTTRGTRGAEGQVVAAVSRGAFMPWDPVSTSKVEAWAPGLHASVREARRALTEETHRPPCALMACSVDDLPGLAAADPLVLHYALELNATESILPWWESEAAVERHGGYYDLHVDEYRRELAQALLMVTRPEITAPVRAAADRLQRLADEIERATAPALGEAAALGCPDTVLRTLRAPLGAAVAALRAATEERLLRQTRAGTLAVAALEGAFVAEPSIGDAEPAQTESAAAARAGRQGAR